MNPLLKGPHGDNTCTLQLNWVLCANVAQPDAMVALVDFLFRTETRDSTEATIEGRIAGPRH